MNTAQQATLPDLSKLAPGRMYYFEYLQQAGNYRWHRMCATGILGYVLEGEGMRPTVSVSFRPLAGDTPLTDILEARPSQERIPHLPSKLRTATPSERALFDRQTSYERAVAESTTEANQDEPAASFQAKLEREVRSYRKRLAAQIEEACEALAMPEPSLYNVSELIERLRDPEFPLL